MQSLSRHRNDRLKLTTRLRLLSLSALAFGGCSSLGPSDSELPQGALPVPAQAEYAGWFMATEECSGLRGQFHQIQWFVVPGVEAFQTSAGPKVGMWEKSGGVARIIIAGKYAGHEMVIRHEMLHHLLDREGHPDEYFSSRCRLTWDTWRQGGSAD